MDEVTELYWALNEHASALQADQHVTRRKCKFVALCGKVLAGVNKCKVRQYGPLSTTYIIKRFIGYSPTKIGTR